MRSVAAWTWAIDAAASGALSNDGEDVLQRDAEVFLDHLADDFERLGGHLIAALLELLDQLGREQPLAAGDDLAELDVGRAEPFGGTAQPGRDVAATGLGRGVPLPLAAQPPRPDRGDEATGDGDHPKTRRQPAGPGERWHVGLGGLAKQAGNRIPQQCVAVEHPRPVVGERSPVDVVGVHHTA